MDWAGFHSNSKNFQHNKYIKISVSVNKV
jgi:hypothetical protein